MRKQGFRKFHKIKQTGFGTKLDEYHKKKPRISLRFLTWCLQDGYDGDFFIKLWNRGGRTGLRVEERWCVQILSVDFVIVNESTLLNMLRDQMPR